MGVPQECKPESEAALDRVGNYECSVRSKSGLPAQEVALGTWEAFSNVLSGRIPVLRPLVLMTILEVTAFSMHLPVVSFFVIEELGLDPSEVGTIMASNNLVQLFGVWICGRASDTFGRKPFLIFAFLWSALQMAALPFIQNSTQLLVLRILQGISGGTVAILHACILDVVPENSRASYMGLFGCIMNLSFVSGTCLGLMLSLLGVTRRNIFFLAAALALSATLFGVFFVTETLQKHKRRPLYCTAVGADTVRASDWEVVGSGLLSVWACRFFSALATGFMFATYAFLIKTQFDWNDTHFGVVLGSCGIVGAISQAFIYPVFGRSGRTGSALSLGIGSVMGMISYILLPTPSVAFHVLALFFFALAGGLIEPAVPVLVSVFAGDRHLGFGNGVSAACRCGATVLAPLLGGMLYEWRLAFTYYVGSVLFLVSALISIAVAWAPDGVMWRAEVEPFAPTTA